MQIEITHELPFPLCRKDQTEGSNLRHNGHDHESWAVVDGLEQGSSATVTMLDHTDQKTWSGKIDSCRLAAENGKILPAASVSWI